MMSKDNIGCDSNVIDWQQLETLKSEIMYDKWRLWLFAKLYVGLQLSVHPSGHLPVQS